jgi:hypothetical protein
MTNDANAESRVRTAMTTRRRRRSDRSELAATIRWLNELRPRPDRQVARRVTRPA